MKIEYMSFSRKEKASCLVHLRSNKLSLVKQNVLPKVTLLFEELNIPMKPTMCTSEVCSKYGELRDKAVEIVELRKQMEKLEHDIKVLHTKGSLTDDQNVFYFILFL